MNKKRWQKTTSNADSQKTLSSSDPFLPKDKKAEKKIEKNLKRQMGKKIYKRNLPLGLPKKKSHLPLKIATLTVVGILGGYMLYNDISTQLSNNAPPTKDPHASTEDLFDPNGNNFDIKDNQIVTDTMTEEEKTVLSQIFKNLVFDDANSRFVGDSENDKIGKIKTISSISLIPCNLYQNNEFDKYLLSVLFQDDKNNTYALNYFTGQDFQSNAQTSKDFFSDFLIFLNSQCYLYNCSKMSENGQALKDLVEEKSGQKVLFVGDAFFGFAENSGHDQYFVPVYDENGTGNVYYTLAAPIDSYDKNPMTELIKFLSSDNSEDSSEIFSFLSIPFAQSENLKKVTQIYASLQTLNNEEMQTQSQKENKNDEMTK